MIDAPFGSNGAGATAMSGGAMRAEDVIHAAMNGQRVEQIPKTFDFAQNVQRINQVLSYEGVNGFMTE